MTPPNESGGGGMTGATGDLTPDDVDKPFIPAERREISHSTSSGAPPDDEPPMADGPTPVDGSGDEFSHHDDRF